MQFVKTKIIRHYLLAGLCGAIITPAGFGQMVQVWTGGNGMGTDLGAAINWGGTVPSTALPGDTGQWDGVVPGDLFLTYNGGMVGGFGHAGINFVLTPNQTGSVHIGSPFAFSANLAIFNLTNTSAHASLHLGDSSANVLNVIWRPGNANQLHELVNHSASPNIIHPNVRWQSGGGVTHILAFGGTGDWIVTNNFLTSSAGPLIRKNGPGTMFWNGPSIPSALGNGTISTPITINSGTLVLQNNTVLSPSGVGNTGAQNIVNNGTLQYDAPAQALTLAGVISGSGQLRVSNGTLTLAATNTYSGTTEITNNGTLVASSVGGDLAVRGGTLVPGGGGPGVTLNVAGNLNISAGAILVALHKSSSPSNSLISVGGSISSSGGTVKLLNYGPAVVVGDEFTLFNQPVVGGAALTIVTPGFSVANDLAVDGSVTVIAVAPPAVIKPTLSGGTLNLSWPAAWTGAHLQRQTNSLQIGLGPNWVTISGSDTTNNYATAVSPNASVFYRLAP